MKVCIIEDIVRQNAVNTWEEIALLLEHGIEVTLIGAGNRSVAGFLPDGCQWIRTAATGRVSRRWELLKAAIQVRADFFHAHSSVLCMSIARAAAVWNRGRYFGDFNNVIVMAQRDSNVRQEQQTFEQQGHWEKEISENEARRIDLTVQSIPQDAQSVLDVGCGDGRVTNRIAATGRRVIGLDNATTALNYLDANVVATLAQCDNIPLEDRSVDLAICTEVIEHLPADVYTKTLKEFARVSSRYVMISVPLEEQLTTKNIVCPVDGAAFNVNGHLRNFDRRDFSKLLPGFHLNELIELGAPRRHYYSMGLLWIKQRIGGVWARPAYTICPRCGSNLAPTNKRERNVITKWCDRRNKMIASRRQLCRSHALAIYERISQGTVTEETSGLRKAA